jgi:hypothetical protein
LIDDACALMLVQPSDAFHAIGLSMMVSVVAGEKGVVGRYRYRFTSSGIETVQVQSDRPSDRGYYDHLPSEGIAIVINFLADIPKCIGAHTDQSFYVMHQAAGVCGHCFALAAARHNMFVRPLRAYSEWRLGALWEPQEQILLQLVSGFPRRASLRFDIG